MDANAESITNPPGSFGRNHTHEAVGAALRLAPGLALTAGLAALAFAVHAVPRLGLLSPMILSITAGVAIRNLIGTPARAQAGMTFALRRVLRFAIILLGLQLTTAQVLEVGATGVAIIVAALIGTFMFTTWLGEKLGVARKLTELIAAGTSICGASAVIAVNTVTNADDEDVAYAVACVTVFGTLAFLVYPLLPGLLRLDPHAFGLWSGASIHEIAQVVAAAFQDGPAAGQFGTIAKLTRVMMLAPVVLTLGLIAKRRADAADRRNDGKVPLPWFALGFIAMVGLNSVIAIPQADKAVIITATSFLLSMSLAAMGLETDIGKLRAKGLRPLLLGAAAFAFIASFSLILIKIIA